MIKLLFVVLLAQIATAQGGPATQLKPCNVPNVAEEVRCGTYSVWEDRDKKAGRQIPLNIVVLPALASTPAPDPLVVLVGGPGQAATAGAAGDAQRFAGIRQQRDVVLIDQRGAGKSNPLNCDLGGDPSLVMQVFTGGPMSIERMVDCRKELEQHADLRMYTTPFSVDDVNEVVTWLGYKQVNLYGGSYGTRAALEYVRRHPGKVRTATLRAPFLGNPLESIPDAQGAWELLLADCAKEEACAKTFPNVKQELENVLARLQTKPIIAKSKNRRTGAEVEVEVTRDMFGGIIARMLADPNTARGIPQGIRRAFNGDFMFMEGIINQLMGLSGGISLGLNLTINCAETVPQIKETDLARVASGSLIGDTRVRKVLELCRSWTAAKMPKSFYEPTRSDVPVLILSGVIDPQAPPRWGDLAVKTLPNSLHLRMEGIAHGPFPNCAVGIMTSFIAAGTTKDLDSGCLRNLKRPAFSIPASTN